MKITSVTAYLMQAGLPSETAWSSASSGGLSLGNSRHWCFVRVETDAGITGVGEGSGWPKVVATAIDDLRHLLIGEDPRDIDRLWHKMFLSTAGHGQTGTIGAGAITALDTALWDIKAKSLDIPVWQLLGGKFRSRVPAYAHASSVETGGEAVAAGYRALKTGNPKTAVSKVASLREAFGPSVDIAVDLHGPPWLAAQDAARLARKLEPFDLLFLEEPVPPEDVDGLRLVRSKTDLPLAAGERTALLWGYRTLVYERMVDILQPDTGRAGGLTQMRKIAALAESNHMSIAPHSGTLGPIAEYACAHLMAAIPNALIMERFFKDWPGREKLLTHSLAIEDGHVVVPDRPGLGVDFDPAFVDAHPAGVNIVLNSPAFAISYEPGTASESLYVQPRRARASFFGDG